MLAYLNRLYTNKKISSNSEGMQRILWTVSAEHHCGIWTSFLGWIWRRLSFLKFLRNFTLIWTVRANLFAYDHYVEWPKINSWVSWGVNTQTSRLWLICSCSILLPSQRFGTFCCSLWYLEVFFFFAMLGLLFKLSNVNLTQLKSDLDILLYQVNDFISWVSSTIYKAF